MKEILEAVLVDPSIRTAEDLEALATEHAGFLSWTQVVLARNEPDSKTTEQIIDRTGISR